MKKTPKLVKRTELGHYVSCASIECRDCTIERICGADCNSVSEARQMIADNIPKTTIPP